MLLAPVLVVVQAVVGLQAHGALVPRLHLAAALAEHAPVQLLVLRRPRHFVLRLEETRM